MTPSAEDFNFHAEKEHRNLRLVDVGKTDGVFFRGDECIERAPVAPFEEAEDFLFGETMVVGKGFGDFNHGPELAHALLETFGARDAAEGADVASAQVTEGKFYAGLKILPMARGVAAFDDGRSAVEGTQAREESLVRFRAGFGDDNVGRAAEIGRRFAESAAGQEAFVAEGRLAVDQDDINPVTQALVLQSVVEEQDVTVEMAQSVESAFDPVLVNQHADAWEILGQHVRFVPGATRIEENLLAVGDDTRREEVTVLEELVAQPLHEGAGDAFVAAAENGDPAPATLQFPRQHFGHGCLACAADGEISHAYHGTAEFLWSQDAAAVEAKTDLHGPFIKPGKATEDKLQCIGAASFAALEYDIDGVAFEPFEDDAHGQLSTATPWLSALRMRTRASGSTDCIAAATAPGSSSVRQATADPDPLR